MRKWIKIISLSIILSCIGLIYLFNGLSHVHFLFDNHGKMTGYLPKFQDEIYSDSEVDIKRIYLRRNNSSFLRRAYNFINRPVVYVIDFKKNKRNFTVSHSAEGLTYYDNTTDGQIFSINSNFFTEDFKAKGLVVVNGKPIGSKSNSSGFFKVIDGKAYAGPASIFSNRNEKVEYACQAHPSVSKNGTTWGYILNETKNKVYWKARTYRSLVGMRNDGNISFVISGNGGLLSVKEMAIIADANKIGTATMLDAGSALQYSFNNENLRLSFSSMNNLLNLGSRIDKLFLKLTGRKFHSSSPTFINYL